VETHSLMQRRNQKGVQNFHVAPNPAKDLYPLDVSPLPSLISDWSNRLGLAFPLQALNFNSQQLLLKYLGL